MDGYSVLDIQGMTIAQFHAHIRRQAILIFGNRRKLSKKREMFQNLYASMKGSVNVSMEDFMVIVTGHDAELREIWRHGGAEAVWQVIGDGESI